MRSKPLQEAYARAEETEKSLTAYDFDSTTFVVVQHEEGVLLQRSAFVKEDGEWIVVFAEHADTVIFHKNDVVWWAHFEANFPEWD